MADLTRIEGLLEDIYLVLRDGNTQNVANNTQPSQGTGRQPSQGTGTPKNLRTGIYEIDRHIDALKRSQQSIKEFGDMLKSTNTKGLSGFGNFLTKYSGNIAGAISIVKSALDLWKGIVEIKNAKATAIVQAGRRDIQENEAQFQRDSTLHSLDTEKFVNEINTVGDIALKHLETEGSVLLQSLKIIADNQVKATEIAVGPLIDGINETAYKAAEYAIDRKKDLKLLDIEREKTTTQFGLYKDLKQQQLEMQTNLITRQKDVSNANYEATSAINAFEKAREVRDAEADVAVKDFFLGLATGAGTGAGTGALVSSETGPGALIGGAIGGVIGMGAGGYAAISDETGKQSYESSKQATSDMSNVFQNNRQFQKPIANFQNDPRMLGKWEKVFSIFNTDRSEQFMKLGLEKFSSEVKMITEGNRILTENANNIQNSILEKQTALQEKSVDLQSEALKIQAESQTSEEKIWLRLAQETEKWLDEFDKVTNNLGKSLGYTNRGQLDGFQKSMFTATQVAAKFGKTYEDAAKYQQDFIETTGRNRIFDEHDYGQMFGLGEYLGDNGLASNYASQMEIFNVGVADSVDMLDNVLQDVNSIGLNGRKYTKTLVDSLKLAQRYNFKGGTENLMKMSKWAENTRFNMNSLGGMLDKVSEGGLEGVITQGAQFQVLGGHAAMNADPIAMMFERYADPEAFAKRMQDMTKGYGSLDRTTGETTFSGTEQMLMEQLAKIQGRSVEDVMNEVRARNKKEVVSKQLTSSFKDDEQSYISNVATYNKKTGQFEVKVKGENGQYETKEVNKLTKEDLESLMPEKHDERMEDYMQTIVDYLGQLTGASESQEAQVAQENWQSRINNYRERMAIANESFANNYQEYVNKAQEYSKFITDSYGDYTQKFKEGTDATEEAVKEIENMANSIAGELGDTADLIKRANQFIEDSKNNIQNKSVLQQSQSAFDASMVLDDYANHTTGHDLGDLHNIMKKIVKKYDNGERNYKAYQNLLEEGYNDLLDSLDAITGKGDSASNYDMDTVQSLVEQYKKNYMRDGIINNNNKPIVSQATNVTKINDGLVQSDPKDVAIFAKEGGVIGDFLYKLYNDVHSSMGSGIQLDTINVQISGSLDLSSGGKSVDIIGELENNPIVMRALSRMLAQQFSKAFNGGKGYLPMSISNVYDFT